MREFFSIFGIVFLAELADKTQLTVMGLSTGSGSIWKVFLAGSLALIVSTALATWGGDMISRFLPEKYMNYGVGILFLLIGAWFLITPWWEN